MKKTIYVLMLLIFVSMSCSQDEAISNPEIDAANLSLRVSKDKKALAKLPPSHFVNLARAFEGNNGQGAIFLEPTTYGYWVSIEKDLVYELVELFPGFFINFVVGGQIASIEAGFGANDFWRQNPDGNVSVKLNSNQAYASVYDFGTGEYYEGTGTLNTKFTGAVEEFCYDPCIPEPCDPPLVWCMTNLTPNPNSNAHVGNGQAKVTNSQGDSKKLMIKYVQNPGGKGHMEFTLN